MDRDELERKIADEWEDGLREVVDANADLEERARGNLHAFYSEEEDLLVLTIGKDKGAVSIELADDFIIRYDVDTTKIIAFELYHFSELLAGHSAFIRFCFRLMEASGPVDIRMRPKRSTPDGNMAEELVRVVEETIAR